MKSGKVARMNLLDDDLSDAMKKATKLEPNKKKGKDKHNLVRSLNNWTDQEEDDEDDYLTPRESILDYYDDEDDID